MSKVKNVIFIVLISFASAVLGNEVNLFCGTETKFTFVPNDGSSPVDSYSYELLSINIIDQSKYVQINYGDCDLSDGVMRLIVQFGAIDPNGYINQCKVQASGSGGVLSANSQYYILGAISPKDLIQSTSINRQTGAMNATGSGEGPFASITFASITGKCIKFEPIAPKL